jgi:hypothetical protein
MVQKFHESGSASDPRGIEGYSYGETRAKPAGLKIVK